MKFSSYWFLIEKKPTRYFKNLSYGQQTAKNTFYQKDRNAELQNALS